MSKNPNKRLPQLDFLRAVAVFMVIGNHSAICPPETNLFLNKITSVWYRGGWTGVDLFFVLSGFLIAGLLFNEYRKRGDVDIKRFLIRRGFKIYPAFWFLIFVTLIVNLASGEPIYRGGFVRELLFVQNYFPAIWEHTWSLAVEEHFYIFLSLLFIVFLYVGRNSSSKSFNFIPKVFILLAVVCLTFRIFTNHFTGFDYTVNIEQTHLRLDALFFGVFLSYLWNFRGLADSSFLEKNRFLIFLVGILCFIPAFSFELEKTFWLQTVGLTMLSLGGGLLLASLLKINFGKSKFLLTLAEIGKYSYSIYLWNLPTHFWLTKFTDLAAENWYFYALLYWSGTLMLGIGTAKLVEYPVLRVREKLFPSNIAALKTV